MVSQFGSLGYTIMGKTADLTVVQKTIIDTLHKEGKPQTFITKEAGCSQSAVSKQVNRMNFGELSKEWTEADVKASRATTHRRVNEFGYSCRQRRLGLRRRTGLMPSGPNSSFQMRASFVFNLETKVLESGRRVEKLIGQVT